MSGSSPVRTRTQVNNSFGLFLRAKQSTTTARRSRRVNTARVGMRLSAHLNRFLSQRSLAITTGKMIAAQFEHTAARPDHETGYAAPQLHTHVVIMNMTKTEQGEIRSVQPLELYRTQQYATAIYRTHLAEKLQALGYQIEVNERTGAPEIKGFSKEYLREASPRREEVKKEAQEMKERLEQ